MRQIHPHKLWLGHIGDASNVARVREAGIAAMIDLAANERPVQVARETVYCRFPLTDGGGGQARGLIRAAAEAAAGFIRSETPTLIFCSAGMSRTPAIAAAALSLATGRPAGEWLREVAAGGPADVSPRLWAEVLAALEGRPAGSAGAAEVVEDARPTLRTERLILRPFTMADAPEVARLAAAREVAATTLYIPHPYALADAQRWLATHARAFARRHMVVWAITLRRGEEPGELMGAMALHLGTDEYSAHRAELGYWIGTPYWGHGYATEAARAALQYGFEVLGLERIYAVAFTHNPASTRLQEKLGMKHEGVHRGHVFKWGQRCDEVMMSMLREEWEQLHGSGAGDGGGAAGAS